MKTQIKNRFTGSVIHEGDYASIYEAVAAAIKSKTDLSCADLRVADLRSTDLCGANLSCADLSCADLCGANLRGADLRGANLSCADLSCADLRVADLRSTDLCGANLSCADLSCADLCGANLRGTNLRGANLSCADLCDANLRGTNLRDTNLRDANLSCADLSCADLCGANLRDAKYATLIIAQTRILPNGEIIGWKKLLNKKIAKLRIPESAKRSNAFGRKCRCSEAVVVAIYDGENEVDVGFSSYDSSFKYIKGEIVRPKKPFSEDWQNECASGIHFFITREEAENY